MEELQQDLGRKSTRTFEEWKTALYQIVDKYKLQPTSPIDDEILKPFYDQGMMPAACVNQIFNR